MLDTSALIQPMAETFRCPHTLALISCTRTNKETHSFMLRARGQEPDSRKKKQRGRWETKLSLWFYQACLVDIPLDFTYAQMFEVHLKEVEKRPTGMSGCLICLSESQLKRTQKCPVCLSICLLLDSKKKTKKRTNSLRECLSLIWSGVCHTCAVRTHPCCIYRIRSLCPPTSPGFPGSSLLTGSRCFWAGFL